MNRIYEYANSGQKSARMLYGYAAFDPILMLPVMYSLPPIYL
jgi:hypothetical protein